MMRIYVRTKIYKRRYVEYMKYCTQQLSEDISSSYIRVRDCDKQRRRRTEYATIELYKVKQIGDLQIE